MPTPFPALMGTDGKTLAVMDASGKRWDQGSGGATTAKGGPRNTALPAPIKYNPHALDWFGKAPSDPATYTTETRASRDTLSWTGATRTAWSKANSITLLGLMQADGVTAYTSQTAGQNLGAPFALEFKTSATEFAIALRPLSAPTKNAVRLWVDGQPHPQVNILEAGKDLSVRVVFPTAKERTIRVDTRFMEVSGIDHPSGTTLIATTPPVTRLMMVGDSYVASYGGDGNQNAGNLAGAGLLDVFGWLLGPLLGVEPVLVGLGGSGYVAKYPVDHFNAVWRQRMHEKVRPDYTVVFGSQNDGGATLEQTTPAARELYTDIARYSRIFVAGPSHYGTATFDTALSTITADPVLAPRVFGYTSPRSWQGMTAGDQHYDKTAHQTWLGHVEYAKRIAAAFAAAHKVAFPEAYSEVT